MNNYQKYKKPKVSEPQSNPEAVDVLVEIASRVPSPVPFTGTAIVTDKVDSFLTAAFELQIENGIVVSVTRISNPDVPATAIGKATSKLWEMVRLQKGLSDLI